MEHTRFKELISSLKFEFKIWHIALLAMITTGLLYPAYDQYTIAKIMIGLSGKFGFNLWCALMVACGVAGFIRPRLLVYWLSPLLWFMVACAVFAFQDTFIHWSALGIIDFSGLIFADSSSYTALIYYSTLYLFPLYYFYRDEHQHEELRLIHRVPPLRVAGVINLLMGIALIAYPVGSGMPLLYGVIVRFTGGVVADPTMLYQFAYLISGVYLVASVETPRIMAQIATTPIILHGALFSIYIIFNSEAWVFIPFFIAISVLWWHMGGRGYGISWN